MKRFFTLACLLVTAMSSFALTIEEGVVYKIANRQNNAMFIQDSGNEVAAVGAENTSSYWVFEAGSEGKYYIKNFTTGKYIQSYELNNNANVTLGDDKAEFVVTNTEDGDIFGICLANQSNTSFNDGACKGLNWFEENGNHHVQAYDAKSGQNNKSFWKLTKAPTSVTLDKAEYKVGEPVVVTYINTPGEAKDWIAIYKAGDTPGGADTYSSTYRYVSGKSGKMTLNVEDAPNWEGAIGTGDYYVAYLLNDGYDEGLSRVSFKVVADAGTLTLDKEEYEEGEPIVVTYANTPGGAKDWIAIYKKGETPGVDGSKSATYRYVTGESGQMTLNVEGAPNWKGAITAGDYYVTYLLNDGYDEALDRAYFTVKNPADHEHHYVNGVCTDDGCTDKYQPATLQDGWYQIANAGNIEWIGGQVEAGKATNMKFVADIDFKGITHTPIGRSDAHKFTSRLDGQGHKIMNLVVNTPDKNNVGFFGWVRGGNGTDDVTIENLTIDKTCSFTGGTRVGAFIGCAQVRSKNININNCVNEATVVAKNGRAAGFIGGGAPNNDHPRIYMNNCVNVGSVTVENESAGNDDKAAAFIAFLNVGQSPNSTLTNCVNLGTITNTREDGNELFVGSFRSYVNCYAKSVPASHDGMTLIEDNSIITSGKLCWLLNDNGKTSAFNQDVRNNNSYPVPTTYEEPTLNGDEWYELQNASQVEWFTAKVNSGTNTIKGKLMADIDYAGMEHTPIGSSDTYKFNGEFDGGGHRIKNVVINRDYAEQVGFFGWLRGNTAADGTNTTIRNLIIDKSCSFTGKNKVGALAGTVQVGGGTITVENVVNEANVESKSWDAGAIFGGENGGNVKYIIRNVVNTGKITSTGSAGALCCYLNVSEGSLIENFLNLGTISKINEGKFNIGRHNIANATNLIDLSDTKGKTQGVVEGLTADDAENGKVAYMMGFKQLIGTDEYPSPFNKAEVYRGWTSLYDETTGYELNGGEAKAYTGIVNGEWLSLTEISGGIPASTPVVMYGTYYNRIAKAGVPAINQTNHLMGSTENVIADGSQYVLAQPENEKVGFYKAEKGTTIAAGKAYLSVDGSNVKAFFFGEDNPTGILNANANVNDNQEIYNLAGQRIQKMQKGINIVGGKKVLF